MASTQEFLQKPRPATPAELQDLSEQIGEFVYYWGFKRIHGKIWTHLFLAKRPLDAADLVQQMQISKALVSISLRELLDFEVIRMQGKSERGTQLYVINPDILHVILAVLRQRERRLLTNVQTSQEIMSRMAPSALEEQGLSAERLQQLGQLVGRASGALESFIALQAVDFGDWQKLFHATDLQEQPAQILHTEAPQTAPASAPQSKVDTPS